MQRKSFANKCAHPVCIKPWLRSLIDLIIPHQANERIIQSSMKKLGLPPEKIFMNLQYYGNTSTASIPIALTEAIEQNRLKPNDNLVMVGFGAGLTWAATAIKWATPGVREAPRWRSGQRSAEYGLARMRSRFLQFSRKVEGSLITEEGEAWSAVLSKRITAWRQSQVETQEEE